MSREDERKGETTETKKAQSPNIKRDYRLTLGQRSGVPKKGGGGRGNFRGGMRKDGTLKNVKRGEKDEGGEERCRLR